MKKKNHKILLIYDWPGQDESRRSIQGYMFTLCIILWLRAATRAPSHFQGIYDRPLVRRQVAEEVFSECWSLNHATYTSSAPITVVNQVVSGGTSEGLWVPQRPVWHPCIRNDRQYHHRRPGNGGRNRRGAMMKRWSYDGYKMKWMTITVVTEECGEKTWKNYSFSIAISISFQWCTVLLDKKLSIYQSIKLVS